MKHKLTALLLVMSASCVADISVIVATSNTNSQISEDDLSRLFLGKNKSFANGEAAVPINSSEGNASRDAFDNAVLKKNSAQLKSYWSQLVFTGKGTPPKEVGNDDEVKKLVAANPNMIGYIDSGKVDGSVKVIYSFK